MSLATDATSELAALRSRVAELEAVLEAVSSTAYQFAGGGYVGDVKRDVMEKRVLLACKSARVLLHPEPK